MQGQYTSGAGSISQKASVAAFNGPQEPVEEMRKAFERRRNLIVQLAREIPGFEVNDRKAPSISSQVLGLLRKVRRRDHHPHHSTDFALYLLNTAHVAAWEE